MDLILWRERKNEAVELIDDPAEDFVTFFSENQKIFQIIFRGKSHWTVRMTKFNG